MNISLNCKISLSKKLRALLKNGGTITLTTSNLVDGKGDGKLLLSNEGEILSFNKLPEELKGETSIMLTPIEISNEEPSATTQSHGIIFNNLPRKGQSDPIVDRIAAVHAPEANKISKAIKKDNPVPEVFSELNIEECKNYITDLQNLIAAANLSVKTKKSDIDIGSATSDEERVTLIEMKDRAEAIDTPAWVINEKAGRLTINDLGITLPLNIPVDLGNLSARKILASKDLKFLLKEGFIKFIKPEERFNYAVDEDDNKGSLEVFDNVDEAMEKAFKSKTIEKNTNQPSRTIRRRDEIEDGNDESGENVINLEAEDLERPTEEESMVLNLTKNAPKIKTFSNTPISNKTTIHGDKPKSSSVKPIQRRE